MIKCPVQSRRGTIKANFKRIAPRRTWSRMVLANQTSPVLMHLKETRIFSERTLLEMTKVIMKYQWFQLISRNNRLLLIDKCLINAQTRVSIRRAQRDSTTLTTIRVIRVGHRRTVVSSRTKRKLMVLSKT
jgi:hypothetical protein